MQIMYYPSKLYSLKIHLSCLNQRTKNSESKPKLNFLICVLSMLQKWMELSYSENKSNLRIG